MWEIPFFGPLLLDYGYLIFTWDISKFAWQMYSKYALRPVLYIVIVTIWSTSHRAYFKYIYLANLEVDMSQVFVIITVSSNGTVPLTPVSHGRIHHIDTLHQLKRFWNFGAHAHPAQAQAFIQSNLVMGAGDTDITDNAPMSWGFQTSECLSAPPLLHLPDWGVGGICNIYVFPGTLECATN